MALTYTGPEGKFYAKVTVGKNYQRTLEPIPGESYEIDDPEDGLWAPEGVKADKGPVTSDVTKSDEKGPSKPAEGV